jgi:hypothetical protein
MPCDASIDRDRVDDRWQVLMMSMFRRLQGSPERCR